MTFKTRCTILWDRVRLCQWDHQWLHTSANNIPQRCLSMMTLQPADSAQKQPLELQASWPPCAGSSSVSSTTANCPNSPVTYPAELGQVNSYSLIDSKTGTALGLDTNTPTAQAGGTAGGSVAGTPLTVNGLANGVNNSGAQASTNGQGNGQGSVGAGNGNQNGNGNAGGLNGNGNGIGNVGNGNGSNNGNGNTNTQG